MRQPPAIRRYRNAYAQCDLVHELEALIDQANPPLSTLDVDGWQLRTARGWNRARLARKADLLEAIVSELLHGKRKGR